MYISITDVDKSVMCCSTGCRYSILGGTFEEMMSFIIFTEIRNLVILYICDMYLVSWQKQFL